MSANAGSGPLSARRTPSAPSAKSCSPGSSPDANEADAATGRDPRLECISQPLRERDVVREDDDGIDTEVARRFDDVELVAELLEHQCGPADGRDSAWGPSPWNSWGVKHGDLADRARAGLHAIDLGVHRPDEVVHGRIDAAVRMELIAHAALRPEREHAEALVFERGPVLKRVEVAPRGVELARVRDGLATERPHVAPRHRERGVAP